jgi:hypothetical protein
MFARIVASAALLASSATIAAAQSLPATVLIAHGVPGRDVGAGIDPFFPVDVLVGGKICLLKGLNFGTISDAVDLPAGTYSIAISAANPQKPCSNAAVISATVPLAAGTTSAIVAAVSTGGAPTAEVYGVDLSPVGSGMQRLVVAHAANAPAVDVIASSGKKSVTIPNLQPGTETQADVPAQDMGELAARPVGSNALIGPVAVSAPPQSVVLTLAVGSAASGTATLLTKVIPGVVQ